MVNATGIGPVLRKARLVRGKSIEEASRETRIRAEYLQALERERFENLLGDVYVPRVPAFVFELPGPRLRQGGVDLFAITSDRRCSRGRRLPRSPAAGIRNRSQRRRRGGLRLPGSGSEAGA